MDCIAQANYILIMSTLRIIFESKDYNSSKQIIL